VPIGTKNPDEKNRKRKGPGPHGWASARQHHGEPKVPVPTIQGGGEPPPNMARGQRTGRRRSEKERILKRGSSRVVPLRKSCGNTCGRSQRQAVVEKKHKTAKKTYMIRTRTNLSTRSIRGSHPAGLKEQGKPLLFQTEPAPTRVPHSVKLSRLKKR